MEKKDIYNILNKGERVTLECKKAENSVPKSFWETYSAFANTNGGTVLLGVSEDMMEKDKAKRYEVTGVNDADKICKDLWNTINSNEKVNINLLHNDDVQVANVDGKDIIVINVPRADYSTRPVYINNNLTRGSFKRNHEGDYHCTEQELRMMVRDANEAGNDRMFLEDYTMDDIDIPTLERFRMMFKTNNPEHIWNGLDHKDFLMQLGGYMINRKDHTEGLTMAGLLMFGKGLPIRERFDNLRMDYVDKSNLVGDQRYSDRLTYDGTWENNLFNFIRIVIPRLTRDLPRPFSMQGVIRKDDTPQHKAVREAVTNMIIHADFMLNGILRVEKYDDRFVLTNPGLLKLPIEQIYAGGESKSRNQRMQNMLRMIGYGENLGSGFPLILSAWNEKHWLKPELIEQPELMQVKLVLHIENDKNVTKDVTKDVTKEISERQMIILGLIRENKNLTIPEMSLKTNVTERTIKRDIATLQELGIISREGGRKDGSWIIKQDEE
ncbi:putative transcriptional regulator [Prevotella sp. CAG:487]|nr:putative transcriptional regulator [Prevotella sp. CAG:487]